VHFKIVPYTPLQIGEGKGEVLRKSFEIHPFELLNKGFRTLVFRYIKILQNYIPTIIFDVSHQSRKLSVAKDSLIVVQSFYLFMNFTYFIEKWGVFQTWILATGIQFGRYAIFAGILFAMFYLVRHRKWQARRIQKRPNKWSQYRTEIFYSFVSACIFGLLAIAVSMARAAGYTLIYTNIADYGWVYFGFSIVCVTFLHDTYFYWTHRLMHHPRIYNWMHRVHHLSHNPSPWAAMSFHPTEALIEAGIIVVVFFIPLHPLALFVFFTLSLAVNMIGHLGYEVYPRGFAKHWFGKWQNNATHHNMHHQLVRCNYGLYFNFWDTIMRTNHPQYVERYEEITTQKDEVD